MGLPFFLIHINRIVDFPLYHLWKPPEMALLENHFVPNGPIGLSSCFPALKLFFFWPIRSYTAALVLKHTHISPVGLYVAFNGLV